MCSKLFIIHHVGYLRAIPFEKLGEGMSASGFSDYPPPEFPNFGGYPPMESESCRIFNGTGGH